MNPRNIRYRSNWRRSSADAGMSLVELIVTISVSALVLTLIATLFANGLSSQQKATERTLATNNANAASLQLSNAIRDAAAARIFTTFTNHSGMPQTQLNLTIEDGTGYLCEVWIWEDRADGNTILYKSYYRQYADDRIPGRTDISTWETDAGAGEHLKLSPVPAGSTDTRPHFTYSVGAREGETSVVVNGGSTVGKKVVHGGQATPCGGSW